MNMVQAVEWAIVASAIAVGLNVVLLMLALKILNRWERRLIAKTEREDDGELEA